MWTTQKIRQSFLTFFQDKGHTIVASAPLVPQNDPTLMFVNAGMVPFKDVFTGLEKRPYTTATTAQKCVRAGGKHNDLENVGYTARHHTFFEMMGNFSFGEYFKEKAILYAWTFVTEVLGIDKSRLVVTVYHTDQEAIDLWKTISDLPDERILRITTDDNFWSMGDMGPCGPCSEIFYDHGDHIPGGMPGTPDEDGDRFVEIWNLVFMQYNKLPDGTREMLPNPSIDTGAGLERLAAVMQDTHNNFETDIFKKLIQASIQESGAFQAEHITSHRIIADHLRSSSFLIADGVLPSNEGRGYVLRRIMRRAMRHAYLLGATEPLMHKLVPALVAEMGEAYPELTRAQALIIETLKLEEERFLKTLGRGLKLLEEEQKALKPGQPLQGDIAFKLYDTYGFPLDLTQDILRGNHIALDLEGFERAMEAQKAEARKSWAGSGDTKDDTIWFDLAQQLPETEFLGYSTTTAQGQVLALVQDGQSVQKATRGRDVMIITNQTPFYAESGGQVGDQGLLTASGVRISIADCLKKAGKLMVHIGTLDQGDVAVGDPLEMVVDHDRRQQTKANHSATHLLHAVLRHQLGDQVVQKGSLVGPNRLRFDFSYSKALTPEQLCTIEDEVNMLIRHNTPTSTKIMVPEDALKTGAMALFGEKYGDEVRVISMGPRTEERSHYSVEFCGGTHVTATGDIGYFKIVSESGIAAGIRRIEALTGSGAEAYGRQVETISQTVASLLKTKPDQLVERVTQLLEERKTFEKDLKKLKEKMALGGDSGSDGHAADIKTVGSIRFLSKTLEDTSAKDLKPVADSLKQQVTSGVVVLGSSQDDKASLVVAVTDDLTTQFSAVDLVRVGAQALGGSGGGGRPDMAQAGGPDGKNLQKAYDAIEKLLAASA